MLQDLEQLFKYYKQGKVISRCTHGLVFGLQSKKEAEEQAQRELNELFAQAIKQPKVPVGEQESAGNL